MTQERDYYDRYWRRFYATRAKGYDRKEKLFAPLVGGRRRLGALCYELLSLRTGSQVLDLCCGTGLLTRGWSRRGSDRVRVYGLDRSREMIERARSTAFDETSFVQADAQIIPFEDHLFDGVVLVAALHEMPHEVRFRVLSETRRVLKPAGVVVVGEHHVSHRKLPRFLQSTVFRAISKTPERSTAQDLIRRGLDAEFREAGLERRDARVMPGGIFSLTSAVPSA